MRVSNLIFAILLFVTLAGFAIGISLYLQPEQSQLGIAIIIGAAMIGAAAIISGLNDAYDFIGKLKKEKTATKDYSESIPTTSDEQSAINRFSSFAELARHIWPYIAANGRAFLSFGPNSGADNANNLRWDMQLWEETKIDTILPNNRRILELIDNNQNLIPSQHRITFDRMITHIYAFEKHCEDPTFSYAEHQFPSEFAQIIDNTCVEEEQKQGNVTQYEEWLTIWFQLSKNVKLIDAHIVGSTLRGHFPNSDVDLFVLIDDQEESDGEHLVAIFDMLKDEFQSKFSKPLHVMVFSKSEKHEYDEFLNNIGRKKKFDRFRIE